MLKQNQRDYYFIIHKNKEFTKDKPPVDEMIKWVIVEKDKKSFVLYMIILDFNKSERKFFDYIVKISLNEKNGLKQL